MSEADSNNNNQKPKRAGFLVHSIFYLGLMIILLSAVNAIVIPLNDGLFSVDGFECPNPVAERVYIFCRIIVVYAALLNIILLLLKLVISSIMFLFKLPRSRGFAYLVLGLIFTIIGAMFDEVNYQTQIRNNPINACKSNMIHVRDLIDLYKKKHQQQLPSFENWHYALDMEAESMRNHFRCEGSNTPEELRDYALNSNLKGLQLDKVPGDVVLLFETNKPDKTPLGTEESITAKNHKGKGIIIMFADFHLEYVRAKDFDKLRWKP